MPAVSVIIPTYNHRAFVLETLDSVFAQTFTDYEIVVINDSSPDDTAALLRPLAEAGRIRYFEQPNQGQASARNRGLAEARGEFIAFLDDDDLWPAEKLRWQVEVMRESDGIGVVYGQKGDIGDPMLSPVAAPSGQVFEDFVRTSWIQSPGQALIRARDIRAIGGFDASIWGTDDWDLWLRLAHVTQFAFRPLPALSYRRHGSNASRDFLRMHSNARRVLKKHLGNALKSRPLFRQARGFVNGFTAADGMREVGNHIAAGRPVPALTALAGVARIRPRLVLTRDYLSAALRAVGLLPRSARAHARI
ncbi:MAG TPA: glycosyltransferase family A protein [Chthoniobacteraceae bacterium]|jgi:glycosyltransferase involved in cell wall biosynthesis|nr:glycosyltransferase family A protein [Chthoniobacteraceae bacterium]